MKAAVFTGVGKWQVEQRPDLRAGPGEILVEVQAAGVCRTDTHIFRGDFPARFPIVPGHEFSGIVRQVGAEAADLEAGQLVSVDPVMACGVCDYCRRSKPHFCRKFTALGVDDDGGFATHCLVPAANAYPVAEGVTPEEAALAEPIACCVHGLELASPSAGDCVAVLGAGWIGLLMVQLALIHGAGRVVVSETLPHRRDLAKALGAHAVVDAAAPDVERRLRDECGGGADLVIECVGSAQTSRQAIALARDAGCVLIFGVAPPQAEMTVKPYEIYRRELRVMGAFSTPKKQSAALALLAGKRLMVEPMITHRFGLDQFGEALKTLDQARGIKVLVIP
jgi:2-desacetyl-2-hydroxyethyl bacteriochlorophyllide A dehydrogenase